MGIPSNASPMLKKLLRLINIFFIAQICIGFFDLIFSFMNGLMTLMQALILYYVKENRNFCTCIVYEIMALMSLVETLALLGAYVSGDSQSKTNDLLALLISLKIPFYILALYYTFLTYRELKALSASGQYFQGAQAGVPHDSPPPSYQPFQGRGHYI